MINVIVIRHAYSKANEFKSFYNYYATDEKYRNSGICERGFNSINRLKDNIYEKIKNTDIIICSPIKRAIQTCLLILDQEFNKNIKLVPLVAEIGNNLIENHGSELNDINTDIDLNKLNNFDKLDLGENEDTLFYYDYGWKKNENDTWIHLDSDILKDFDKRIIEFKNFLSNEKFKDFKHITIFSHYKFIKKLTGIKTNNLDIVSFNYDTKNQIISDIKYIENNANLLY